MSKHHHNHYRQFVVRIFVVCCLLSAVILVWTQQYEYVEEQRHRFKRHDYSGSTTTTTTTTTGGVFKSWWVGRNNEGDDESDDDVVDEKADTFSCKIHKMNMTMPQAPSLIIAGAPKCGTTTLAHWLLDHPRVLPTKKWECHFFNTGIHPREFGPLLNITTQYTEQNEENDSTNALSSSSRDDLICQLRKRYLRHWPELTASLSGDGSKTTSSQKLDGDSDAKYYTFDKTPDYLYNSRIPSLIRALFRPHKLPKIVVILRDPIDRAYSHYRMSQRLLREEHVPFEEFITRELGVLGELGLSDFQADLDREPNISEFLFDEAATTVATDNSISLEKRDELYDEVSDRLQGHNYLSRGLYAMQLERWFRQGFAEELLIIPYTELSHDPAGVYSRILEFVGMPEHSLDDNILNKRFNYNQEQTTPLNNSTRLWLRQFYHQANEELADLLEEHNRTLGYQWRGRWGN